MKNNISTYVIIVLLMLSFISQCNNNKKIKRELNRSIELTDSLFAVIKSTEISFDDKIHNLKLTNQIENLKTRKQILYDWNAVIRTKERPDDLMNKYDIEINKLINEQ